MGNNNSERTDCFKVYASNPISYGFNPASEGTILNVNAHVHTRSVKTTNGECKVTAQALFTVISENDDGLYEEENLVTFDIDFKNERIADDSPVSLFYSVSDVKFVLNGDEYLISAIIDSEADFLTFDRQTFPDDFEGTIVKNQQIEGLCLLSAFSEISDFDGEKETSFEIKNMLCHEEFVRIGSVGTGIDRVYVSGEIISEFLVVSRRGEPIKETMTVPFRFESQCSDCLPENKVIAFAEPVNAAYRVENDERKSTVSGTFSVNFTFNVFKNCNYSVVSDCFSQKNELTLGRSDVEFTRNVGTRELKYKCFGEAASDKGDDYVTAVTSTAVTAFDYNADNGKLNLSGVVKADLLVRNKEGGLRKAQAELPFACEFDYDGTPVSAGCFAAKFTAKDLDGKCVAECELIFATVYYENKKYTAVISAEEGEPKKPDDCAVRIVFVEKGDDCWAVCKKAGVAENDLLKQNPDLVFPAENDSGIVIYRKL